jgi:type IV secretory pathway VirB2 component (pilin)
MEKIQALFESIPASIRGASLAVAAVCLIVAGFMFMGNRESKEKGKEKVLYVLLGVGIILMAPSIITWVATIIG